MTSEKEAGYRWVILSIFVISQFILSIVGFGWGSLAPFLKKVMALNATQIGLISSSFYFTSAMAAFPAGVAVDRYGVRVGLILWLGLTGLPLFFLSFIHYYYLFLVVAALSGLGYGIGNPVASKGLFVWFDQRTRGTTFGIRQAAVTAGGAAAGIFLVYLCERMGPFSAIRIISLMIIVIMGFAIFFYRDPAGYGSVSGRGSKKPELRVLFNNIPLLLLSVYMAMLALAQGVIITFLILYLNEKLGYSLIMSGFFLAMLMIGAAAGRILWGLLSDRMFDGRRKPALLMVPAFSFASITALACWTRGWPDWLLMIVVIFTGMSSVGWASIGLVTVSEISDRNKTASSVGLASTIGWSGMFVSPIVFGSLTDHFGYLTAWFSIAVFCLLSFILCLFIPIRTRD
ncbi:MAG: MFS transporter [Deltaproteobacteria bacterium]|nr:MFS transporter [Deltaproteobacteria bacterium]